MQSLKNRQAALLLSIEIVISQGHDNILKLKKESEIMISDDSTNPTT